MPEHLPEQPAGEPSPTGRRQFLTGISSLAAAAWIGLDGGPAAAAAPAAPAAAALPTIQLGQHRISRLVAGSNPILGYSYLGPHTDQHMKEYFTPERTVEFLQNCERAGITAHQFADPDRALALPPPAPRARQEDAVHLPARGARQDPGRRSNRPSPSPWSTTAARPTGCSPRARPAGA